MVAPFAPNSELLPDVSVAIPVIVSPVDIPLTVSVPMKLPLASAVRSSRISTLSCGRWVSRYRFSSLCITVRELGSEVRAASSAAIA